MLTGSLIAFVYALIVYPTSWFYLWYFGLYFLMPGMISALSGFATYGLRQVGQWTWGLIALAIAYFACEFVYGSFVGGWWGSGFSYLSLLYFAPFVVVASLVSRGLLAIVRLVRRPRGGQ